MVLLSLSTSAFDRVSALIFLANILRLKQGHIFRATSLKYTVQVFSLGTLKMRPCIRHKFLARKIIAITRLNPEVDQDSICSDCVSLFSTSMILPAISIEN